MAPTLSNINTVYGWQAKAHEFGVSDPQFGSVVIGSFDLMITVMERGLESEKLPYVINSLRRKRESVMKRDRVKNYKYRSMLYGMSESLERMLSTLIEMKTANTEEPFDAEEDYPRFTDHANNGDAPKHSGNGPSLVAPKMEPESVSETIKMETPDCDALFQEASMTDDIKLEPEDWPEVLPTQPGRYYDDEIDDEPGTSAQISRRRRLADGLVDDDDVEDEMTSPHRYSVPKVGRCSICSMTFRVTHEQQLQDHERLHTGFDCLICCALLSSAETLSEHMVATHPHFVSTAFKRATKYPKNYHCNRCNNSYRTPSALQSHMGVHTKKRPFACTEPGCKHACLNKSDLKSHLRRVHQIDPHECETCGKRFNLFLQLRAHWDKEDHKPATQKRGKYKKYLTGQE